MQRFAQLFQSLDLSTSTRDKVEALKRHWASCDPADAAWAAYFLSGGRPRRALSTTELRQWAAQRAGIDDWLFEACYQAVGDLAETVSHLLPPPSRRDDLGLSDWMHERLLPLRDTPTPAPAGLRLAQLSDWCDGLEPLQRFVLFKLIGGGWRVGVSKQLVIRSLAEHAGLPSTLVAQRMMGYTDARHRPDAAAFLRLVAPSEQASDALQGTQPFPFFLAHPLDGEPASLGPIGDWLIEWKFDGIRAQLVRRDGECGIWSRGEELLSESFPELMAQLATWPDGTALDGEILALCTDAPAPPSPLGELRPAPFAQLQKRILRKRLTPALLAEIPVAFVPYDVLEWQGQDQRSRPQRERRQLLEEAVAPRCGLRASPRVSAEDWPGAARARQQARELGVEGLMLKHQAARYGVGRTRTDGVWLKWKLEPMTVDAVLIYAQAGHGRRASLYTDYTFAVWSRPPRDAHEAQAVVEAIAAREPARADGLQLVTFAKAYSGLTDAEITAVDKVIRQTTVEKFGPVRSLRPTLVFELGFEGISASSRHKSGVAVRFPRILRWRLDKPLHEADALVQLTRWL
ncbi:MAG: ATP-dependent DNA ligase [Burkholderiales bacterium]|nr:ATP-dependent DNA ligase [Burkholderiales bacterium]